MAIRCIEGNPHQIINEAKDRRYLSNQFATNCIKFCQEIKKLCALKLPLFP